MMQRILIVGFGDIGKRFSARYASQLRLFVVSRTKPDKSLPSENVRFNREFRWLQADLDRPATLKKLSGISSHVVYLAPPNPNGVTDTRLRNFLSIFTARSRIPQRLVYVSTTGVYGDCAGQIVSETKKVNPETDRARRRMDAESQLRFWSEKVGCEPIILRVPGIYASDRLPINRFSKGLPSIISSEDRFSNHIHADDLTRIIFRALFKGKTGRIYNCVDDSRILVGDYFDLVADRLGFPRAQRLTVAEVRQLVPAVTWSFMRESRLVSNHRIKHELDVRLIYPSVSEGVPFKDSKNDIL